MPGTGGFGTPLFSGYRGTVIGIAVGLLVAGIPAAVLYGQNGELNRDLSDARSTIANNTRTIDNLEISLGNLTAEIQLLQGVANFSHVTLIQTGNQTIPKNNGYSWSVGGPYMNMNDSGYIAVLFRGGVANSAATSMDAHLGISYINRSVTWGVETRPQIVLFSYLPPMGGSVEFVNDGILTVWVNFQILYLT